jgi:hypothetical protein
MSYTLGDTELFEFCKRAEEYLTKERLDRVFVKANRMGNIVQIAELLGIAAMLPPNRYQPMRSGRIVVIGASEISERQLSGIASSLGIAKRRLEFALGYGEAQTAFDFQKLRYAQNYSLVIVGPMPHKTSGAGSHSSAIAAMSSEEGFPPVIKCGMKGLSITKSSFREALIEAIARNLIETDG